MGLRSSTCMAGIVLVLALIFASEMSTVNATRFIVGDDKHWTFGYNYTDWAIKNAPFHVNDTLVFMYDPPTNITHPHSVYLMNNLRSYLACDLKKARMVGNVIQGGGSGFEVRAKKEKTSLLCMWRTQWNSLHNWAHEVCNYSEAALPGLDLSMEREPNP